MLVWISACKLYKNPILAQKIHPSRSFSSAAAGFTHSALFRHSCLFYGPLSSHLLTSVTEYISKHLHHVFCVVHLKWLVFLSCPLCPLERKCHMESITKQNRKVLCIDPEKCMVIIKYIILHSHVDCASFFVPQIQSPSLALGFILFDNGVIELLAYISLF